MISGEHVTPAVRLVSHLGSGAMGSVWLAEHISLGTQVAVKLMNAQYAKDPEYVERFQREARAAAQIRSPHVVQVLDSGVTAAGVPFILMELLEGETLRSRIQRLGPLPLADVVRLVMHAASALGRAHQIGIVHRDVKPENLFLIEVGGELFLKVLDFGIAKQPPATLQKWMTETGRLLGTPFYMSPEQMVSAKHVDHRTDVWALAAVAYEALTARRPFQGQTFGEHILVVHAGGFTKPSTHRPGLPEAVDAWAERALQRDPEARFGSTRELADALDEAVRTSALAATAPSAPRPAPVTHVEPPRSEEPRPPPQTPNLDPGVHKSEPTLVSRSHEGAAAEIRVGTGRVRLVMGNLVLAGTEAIVNVTDRSLSGTGPVDAAIRAAAGPEIEEQLRHHDGCAPGSAILTGSGRIPRPTRYVLHAVPPDYSIRSDAECATLLRRAHTESLRLAEENAVQSVAFPAMGSHGNGYPIGKAAPIAYRAAVDHLAEHAKSVQLIVFVLLSSEEIMAFAAALASSASTLPGRSRD